MYYEYSSSSNNDDDDDNDWNQQTRLWTRFWDEEDAIEAYQKLKWKESGFLSSNSESSSSDLDREDIIESYEKVMWRRFKRDHQQEQN